MYLCLRTIQNRWVEVFGLAHTLYWSVFHGPPLPFSLYHLQFHSKWRNSSQFSEKQVNIHLLGNVSKFVTSVRNKECRHKPVPAKARMALRFRITGTRANEMTPWGRGLLASLITWAQWAALLVERENLFVEFSHDFHTTLKVFVFLPLPHRQNK